MGFVRQGEIARLGPNTIIRPNRGQFEREDSDAPAASPQRRRLVVVGAGGMLGQRVVDVARVHGWDVTAAPRAEIDITNLDLTVRTLEALSPAVVINCAAFTDVDGAEEREAEALRVNGEGAGNLAKATAALGARLVHVSTDYVFAGDATAPYPEDAPTAPQGAYGRTKLAGEQQVAEHNPNHLICRTAWVFGSGGRNFVDTMVGLARDRDEVQVVDDQIGSPTWTGHLAPALVRLAATDATGVAHTAGGGQVSWCGLAAEVFAAIGGGTRAVPVTTDAFPRPAKRPAWSVLATTRDDVPPLPDWREGVRAHLLETGAAA
ncbi:dTDP-4-dehydrorhamnose reductase [Patulibacter defluvii]|uniref:dTDP-4-dehydrorhamnose reductase n=1 Tax=Patulibacter defluvii TaxID=3095358 RepID=UPI002A75BB26|nr:dTDP-4-dehydrorhamnose reductase [Patulibacter sp. DM4]